MRVFKVCRLLLMFAIVGCWLLLLCDVCCAVVAVNAVRCLLLVVCWLLFVVVACRCLSSVGCL